MNEIKEAVSKFNILFDKKFRTGLPSCWDLQGNLLPWKSYETLLVESKSKIDNTHEKIAVLKGETILNYLNKDFKLLWMVKTLLTEKPTYSRIKVFRMALNKLEEAAKPNVPLWRRCKEWMIEQTKDSSAGPYTQTNNMNSD